MPVSFRPTTDEDIIRALGGNDRTGMCCCPAHEDKTPSLHVSTASDGKVLWYCHAGCSQEAVQAALERRGLWSSGQKRNDADTKWAKEARAAAEEEERKRSLQAHRILRAAAAAKAGVPRPYFVGRGIERVPANAYLLPAKTSDAVTGTHFPALVFPFTDGEILKGAHVTYLTRDGTTNAKDRTGKNVRCTFGLVKGSYVQFGEIDPDAPLIIGEGVETTLSAMQISGLQGIAAGGTSNLAAVRPPPCATMIIAADNDPSGREAATQLAERLAYEGRKVIVAYPPRGDWNDRLYAKDPQSEWRAALEQGEWQTAEQEEVDEDADDNPISALELGTFMQLAFPQRELLLAPWLPNPGLVMFHAPRGEGKTNLVLAASNAVAGNTALLGWECEKSGRVLYVDGELPGASLQERLQRLDPVPTGQFFVLCRDTFLLRKQTMPDLGEEEGRLALDRIIKRCHPKLVVLDSISTLVRSGVENEAESWAPIQDWLLNWRWRGLSFILVSHEGRAKGRPRGTSKREDVLDTMIGLHKLGDLSDDKESIFDLTFTKARDFYGTAAAPMRLHYAVRDGRMSWTHEVIRDLRAEQVAEMLKEGKTHGEIAKELGVSRSYISKMASKMKKRDTTANEEKPATGGDRGGL
jgi:putative DNA primase/helicase